MGGYIFLWLALAVLVGIVGKNRSIGFGWAFGLSLIFSPIVGIIIVLLAKTKKELAEEDKWVTERELGKKAEFKGQIDQAIDHFLECLYDLENGYKNRKLSQEEEIGRQKIIKSITAKIENLRKVQSEKSTSN